MEDADQMVLTQLARWLEAGEPCWLCTVVKTWGSSPRPVGSLLCCNDKGRIAGSLSGGCIEEDLLENLKEGRLAKDKPEVLVYGATPEESDRLGLPCGGQLHVVIEPIQNQASLATFRHIVRRLEQRDCTRRWVDIRTGAMGIEDKDRFEHLDYLGHFDNRPGKEPKRLLQTYGPRYQLFLMGAGQTSIYLADMARTLDYEVIVCDPRQEMLEQWPLEGVRLTAEMPDDAIRQLANDRFTAIIALTHDPRIDDMGLMEALKTDAFFVGALGSTRTSAKRRERLLQLDLTEQEIDRLHGPVGLSIGSKTPAEIAIAILAQLTQIRADAARHHELQAAS